MKTDILAVLLLPICMGFQPSSQIRQASPLHQLWRPKGSDVDSNGATASKLLLSQRVLVRRFNEAPKGQDADEDAKQKGLSSDLEQRRGEVPDTPKGFVKYLWNIVAKPEESASIGGSAGDTGASDENPVGVAAPVVEQSEAISTHSEEVPAVAAVAAGIEEEPDKTEEVEVEKEEEAVTVATSTVATSTVATSTVATSTVPFGEDAAGEGVSGGFDDGDDDELVKEVEGLRRSVERQELLREKEALLLRLEGLKNLPETTASGGGAVSSSPQGLESERDVLVAQKAELSEKLEAIKATDALIDSILATAEKRSGLVGSDYARVLSSEPKLCFSPSLYLRLDERCGQEASDTSAALLRGISQGLLTALEAYNSDEGTGQGGGGGEGGGPAAAKAAREALDSKLGLDQTSNTAFAGVSEDSSEGGGGGFSIVSAVDAVSAAGYDEEKKDKFPTPSSKTTDGNSTTENRQLVERMWEMGQASAQEARQAYWLPESLKEVFSSNVLVEVDGTELSATGPSVNWANSDIPKRIRDEVFKGSSFSVTDFEDSVGTAMLLKGNIRRKALSASAAEVEGAPKEKKKSEGEKNAFEKNKEDAALWLACYEDITKRLAAVPDLDKEVTLLYQIFPLEFLQDVNPESLMEDSAVMDALGGGEPAPAFIVIPKNVKPKPNEVSENVFAAVSLGLTSFASLASAVGAFALNPAFVQRVNDGDVTAVSDVLPVFTTLLLLQVLHEAGHLAAAKVYGVELAVPTLIPSLQLGSFGAITRFLSYPKERKEMFDVALAGPLLSLTASLAVLAYGLSLTEALLPTLMSSTSTSNIATAALVSALPVVPAAAFQSSALLNAVASLFSPSLLGTAAAAGSSAVATAASSTAGAAAAGATAATAATVAAAGAGAGNVFLHPLAVAGLTGVLVNALSLIPVGRTDGGRLLTSAVGRKTAGLAGGITLVTMAVTGFGESGLTSDLFLFYGIFVILFQRSQDIPVQNEVTELDNARFAVFLLVMGLVGAAFLPNPGTVDWSFLAGNEAQFSYKQFFGLSPPSDGFDF